MNPRSPALPVLFAAVVLAAGFAPRLVRRVTPDQSPSVVAPSTLGQRMLKVFQDGQPEKAAADVGLSVSDKRRKDAVTAAEICGNVCDVLQMDLTLDSPALTHEAQLEYFRVLTATYKRSGLSFEPDYPDFIDTVNAFLTEQLNLRQPDADGKLVPVETPPRPLTTALRKKYAEAYDALRAACNYAAKEL